MSENAQTGSALAAAAGGLAGGALGYFAFMWITRQGFYALMVPGALAGLGAGMFVKDRSVLRGTLCGVFAVGLGLFSEWRFAPFVKDPSFGYFLAHAYQLRPITLLLIAGGAVAGYFLAVGRDRRSGTAEAASGQA